MLTFAASLFLFQLANAAMLPIVGAALVYDGESRSSLIVAALIILPQIVVALSAPWVGRQAPSWGRRPLLLIGWGTLPIRALLFAFFAYSSFLVGFQLLDGIKSHMIEAPSKATAAIVRNVVVRPKFAAIRPKTAVLSAAPIPDAVPMMP